MDEALVSEGREAACHHFSAAALGFVLAWVTATS